MAISPAQRSSRRVDQGETYVDIQAIENYLICVEGKDAFEIIWRDQHRFRLERGVRFCIPRQCTESGVYPSVVSSNDQ